MAAGYAVPDAAPWLMTVVDSTGLLRDTSSVGIKAIDWMLGEPRDPHARQERLASSVSRRWRPTETKKPGPSLL